MPVLHIPDRVGPLKDLPPTTTVVTACSLLGIGKSIGYRLIKEGAFPVKVIRFGSTYRVVTADLLRLLELDQAV